MHDDSVKSSVLTVKEAADWLQISERSVWKKLQEGKLKKVVLNGRTYVDTDSAEPASVKANTGFSAERRGHSTEITPAAQMLIAEIKGEIARADADKERYWCLIQEQREDLQRTRADLQQTQTELHETRAELREVKARIPADSPQKRRVVWPWVVLVASVVLAGGAAYVAVYWR